MSDARRPVLQRADDRMVWIVKHIRERYIQEVRRLQLASGRQATFDGRPGSPTMIRYDGGTLASGRRYQAVWPTIGRFILDHSLDVSTLFESLFTEWLTSNKGDQLPHPSLLVGQENLQRAASGNSRAVTMAINSLAGYDADLAREVQLMGWQYRMTPTQATRVLLGDRGRTYSPLFRYVAAVEAGLSDLANTFRDGAAVEFIFHTASRRAAYGSRIPAEIEQYASVPGDRK